MQQHIYIYENEYSIDTPQNEERGEEEVEKKGSQRSET